MEQVKFLTSLELSVKNNQSMKFDILPSVIQCFSNYISMLYNTRSKLLEENSSYIEIFKSKFSTSKKVIIPHTRKNITDIRKNVNMPKTRFFYPLTRNILRSNNYELHYMEKFDTLSAYTKAYANSIKDYDELFHIYPSETYNKEKINNELFWIYILINIISSLNCHAIFDKKSLENVIYYCSVLANKKYRYFYDLYSKFLFKLKEKSAKNQNAEVSKFYNFRNGFCNICFKFYCNSHLNYEISEDKFIAHNETIKYIIRNNIEKKSGFRVAIDINNSANNAFEQSYECPDNINCINNLSKEKIKALYEESNLEYKIVKLIPNKKDLFFIYNLVVNRLLTNSCFISHLLLKKYTCINIYIVVQFIDSKVKENSLEGLQNYFKNPNFGNIQINDSLNEHLELIIPKETSSQFSSINIDNNNNSSSDSDISEDNKSNSKNTVRKRIKGKSKTNINDDNDTTVEMFIPCRCSDKCKTMCTCRKSKLHCEMNCLCNSNCKRRFKGCNCEDGCTCTSPNAFLNNCLCLRNYRECIPEICKCTNCRNQDMYLRKIKKTFSGPSDVAEGTNGLFAFENIKPFELITIYFGELFQNTELERRNIISDELQRNYNFELNNNYSVDSLWCGNNSRLVNHSSHGLENAFTYKKFVRGEVLIGIFALRHINKFEEIFFDYKSNKFQWVAEYEKKYNLLGIDNLIDGNNNRGSSRNNGYLVKEEGSESDSKSNCNRANNNKRHKKKRKK